MNAFQIIIEPFQIKRVVRLEIKKQMNEHSRAVVCGLIEEEDAEKIQNQKSLYEKVRIVLKEAGAKEEILFQGVVNEISIEMNGMFYYLQITAISFTWLLDKEMHFRTFQKRNQTYNELVQEVIDPYEKVSFICRNKDKVLGDMQVQYNETDWKFLKRLVTHLQSSLIVEERLEKAAFYFGLVDKKKEVEVTNCKCKIHDYVTSTGICREYEIECDVVAAVGDQILYHKKPLCVYSAEIVLVDGELRYFYRLKAVEQCKEEPYPNEFLAGISFGGYVTEVENEKLQISIQGDEGRQVRKRWFDYATIYASSEISIWYCMPEKDDNIYLYFPDENINHAYVANAVHHKEYEDLVDTEHKCFRTSHDKEIRFSPTQIKITNHKGLSITLDDEKGIQIKSNKGISLSAEEAVNIHSDGVVVMEGNSAVLLRQSNNMIVIRDGIREHGIRIERQ